MAKRKTPRPRVARTIYTPTGRMITPRQYVARVYRLNDAPCCLHGHFGCAAWDRGPCSSEVQPIEDIEEHDRGR